VSSVGESGKGFKNETHLENIPKLTYIYMVDKDKVKVQSEHSSAAQISRLLRSLVD